MQTHLFTAINDSIRDFHDKLNLKINDLRSEIEYLERLRDLVQAALIRDNAAKETPPESIEDELEAGMRSLARKLAPEKAR